MTATDNEELDALVARLVGEPRGISPKYAESRVRIDLEAATAIRSLRARLQAAEHTIAVKYSGATPCCGQYATCQLPCTPRYRVRAELAESQLQQVKADAERWKEQVDECSKYLKEGETPRQRMDRDFSEMQTVLKVWGESKQRAEQRIAGLESERLAGASVYEGGYRCQKCGEVVEMKLHSVNFAQQQSQQRQINDSPSPDEWPGGTMEPLDPKAELMRLAKEFRVKYWRDRSDERRDCAALESAITLALAAERRRALEEARKICEQVEGETYAEYKVSGDQYDNGQCSGADTCGAKIDALVRKLVDGKAGGT